MAGQEVGRTPISNPIDRAVLGEAPGLRRLCRAMAASIAFLAVLWAADLATVLRISVYTEQLLAVVLGLSLAIVYLRRPMRRGTVRLTAPWYDRLAALVAVAAGAWLLARFPVLTEDAFYHPVESLILAAMLVVLTVEALRRATGYSLLAVLGAFALYGLLGDFIPGKLQARPIEPDKLIAYLGLDTTAMLGAPLLIATTVVVVFVLLGRLLLLSGGSDFFTDLAAALLGRSRGGSAKIAVTASALFGSISGSAVSNVVSTGVITIPLMRNGGYSARTAGAIEAVASTGGQLMPPIMGAAAFLMAEFLQVPYRDIVVAAILPAFLFYAAVFIYTDFEAGRSGIRPLDPDRIPRLGRVLGRGWHLVLPFAVLIAVLFVFNRPAATAALAGVVTLGVLGLFFGYGGRRLSLRAMVEALGDTGFAVVDIVIICAAAGMIIGILDLSGLSFGLGLVLLQLGEHSLALLLILTAVVCIVLGMGMPTTGVYLLLATLAAPPLINLGIDPIAAHMFVLYFGMLSMITPPVAIAAFAAANLAGASPMATALTAVRFAWPAYVVPFLFVLSPTLLLDGATGDVIRATVTALAGVWMVTAGLAGFQWRPLSPLPRVLFVAVGAALLIPANAFAAVSYLDIAAILAMLALLSWEYAAVRRAAG